MASAGWRKNEGVPVEASVALIFLQMMPDLPRPMVTTRPFEALINSTTSTKLRSRCSIKPRIAADSTSRTRLASARAGWSFASRIAAFFRGLAMLGILAGLAAGPPLLRQQKVVQHLAHRCGHADFTSHAHDGAKLRVELGWFSLHDIALQ